ncbi:hypothetical protein PT974_07665 [Cladobotryum mycophilum]|uniref:Killer toxin Kp4 domain-containing protein n=1 Tax=Cladobotryum mycophilum TaxID=491253 RepID=A0ABR0SPX6_9HYPO
MGSVWLHASMCAYYQIGSGSSADRAVQLVQALIDYKCINCSSAPTLPGNDASKGELAVNIASALHAAKETAIIPAKDLRDWHMDAAEWKSGHSWLSNWHLEDPAYKGLPHTEVAFGPPSIGTVVESLDDAYETSTDCGGQISFEQTTTSSGVRIAVGF